MNLSKKSWHFRLYKLLYGDYEATYELPTNFCPYFWKGIVVGVIFTIPLIIWHLTLFFSIKIIRRFYRDNNISLMDDGLLSFSIAGALISNLCFFILFFMIGMFFVPWKFEDSNNIFMFGIVFWGITIGIGIFFSVRYFIMKASKIEKVGEERKNLLVEGIKAWYKRNCPLILWKD